MRFCNMKAQDSIGHLENEIHFQQQAAGILAAQNLKHRGHGGQRGSENDRGGLCICAIWLAQPRIELLMSTLTATGVPVARRSSWLLVLFWLLLVVALVVACAIAYVWFIARSALPQLDGNLQVKGLSAAVKVTRDGHGVPTIEAATPEDLFLAQGYVTAQDRLWQMDIMRRFAAGDLSEILGEDTLAMDREQRILGLRAAARKSLQIASPRDLAYF